MRRFDSIIDRPHHVSVKRPRMSMHDRAAQFAPFAALTGFGAAITETARLTEERIELDDDEKARLDEQFRGIRASIAQRPEVTFTCFVPDARKAGGAYVTVTGRVKRIDALTQSVTLTDGAVLSMADICAMEGELFRDRADREE